MIDLIEEIPQHTVVTGLWSLRISLWIRIRIAYNIFTFRKSICFNDIFGYLYLCIKLLLLLLLWEAIQGLRAQVLVQTAWLQTLALDNLWDAPSLSFHMCISRPIIAPTFRLAVGIKWVKTCYILSKSYSSRGYFYYIIWVEYRTNHWVLLKSSGILLLFDR